MIINDIKEFGEKPFWRRGGGCVVVLRPVHDIMVIWELSVLKWSEQCCLELPQSLHSYISLHENEEVGGMKFWGEELFELKQLLWCKGQRWAGLFFQAAGPGRWVFFGREELEAFGEERRGWWLTSACAVPNPRKTWDQPQRDVNQPSHGQPLASCTFLCFPGFSISGSLENDRPSWHQSAHTLLACAAQHFCQVTKRERLMTTSAEALAGLHGGGRRSYLPKSPQEVLAQEWNCTQVNGFVLQIWSWFKLGDIPITWKQSALWCWHQLLAAHGTWEVLSACLLHRTCSDGRSTLSSTLT